MSDQDKFERVLAALHEAMLDDTLWPATSALIDDACGMVGNALLIRHGSQDDSPVSLVGFYYRGERRENWEREYMDLYYPINEAIPRFRQLPDNSVVPTSELYTAQELKTSPTYNEAFLSDGVENGQKRIKIHGHRAPPLVRFGERSPALIRSLSRPS